MYQNSTYDEATRNKINVIMGQNIEKLFDMFDIETKMSGRYYVCRCPIHGGDNNRACNISVNEDYPHFRCNTKHCEKIFHSSLIGFVRGILSAQKCNWCEPGDKTYNFQGTIKFILEQFGIDAKKTASVNIGENNLTRSITVTTQELKKDNNIGTRENIRRKLQIPSPYFLKRGFSATILDKYDVGLCTTPGSPFNYRSVVPIYDDAYKFAVGYSARSIYEKCPACEGYHSPSLKTCASYPKWLPNEGFRLRNHLYNYWFSKEHIEKSGTLIMVESPGNIWRLEEADIHNGVAIFGNEIAETQQILVEKMNISDILIICDNDINGAGQVGAANTKDKLKNLCRVKILSPPTGKDIGDLTTEEVKGLIYG